VLYFKKRLFDTRWFQYWCMALTPAGFIAVLAGWFVTEIGRQPYIVYGVLRTAEPPRPVRRRPSPFRSPPSSSPTRFVFGAGSYYILKLIGKGPQTEEDPYGSPTASTHRRSSPNWFRKKEASVFSFEHFLDSAADLVRLIATAIFLYILLDGFDLGVGVLFPFAPSERCRDRMMNSIAPFWDGNETWLVLGGGGLFAAFPLAYAILMPASTSR
jgi:hypothetical protein